MPALRSVACAVLRYREIRARVRCGFATYFQPGKGLDHWITEYWHDGEGRWVRIDPEALGLTVLERPEALAVGEFLSGGEAWAAFRQGRIDAADFGVPGTENWGPGEIRGNAIRDLAALSKVEVLRDEWGRMEASYRGETGADYDELMDTIADVCATDDPSAITTLYTHAELPVPGALIAEPSGLLKRPHGNDLGETNVAQETAVSQHGVCDASERVLPGHSFLNAHGGSVHPVSSARHFHAGREGSVPPALVPLRVGQCDRTAGRRRTLPRRPMNITPGGALLLFVQELMRSRGRAKFGRSNHPSQPIFGQRRWFPAPKP